jgi:phosphopantothenoylcysteine decarboxylase/phosphopantothenate--cysteine ligase
MAAAVADYRPSKYSKDKLSHPTPNAIPLTANPDILATIGKSKRAGQITVGFALEIDSSKAKAVAKLKSKKLDMIVLNNPTQPGSEFGGDSNQATLIRKSGKPTVLEQMTKAKLAGVILDEIEKLKGKK